MIAALSLCVCAAASAAEVYGTVELVEGSVQILDAQGRGHAPRVEETVSEGDMLLTGRDGAKCMCAPRTMA